MNELTKLLLVNEDYFNRIVKALELIESTKDDLPIRVLLELEKILRGEENDTKED